MLPDFLPYSKALLKAIQVANSISGNVVLQLPSGRIILSDILYIERSHFVLRGMGVGDGGTEIFCPRPMMYFENPESLSELREYLLEFDKREVQKENNIDLPFSQFAWSGGMIWTQVPGERVKSYLKEFSNWLARAIAGWPEQFMRKVIGKPGDRVTWSFNALIQNFNLKQLEHKTKN